MTISLGPDFTVDNLVSSVQIRATLPNTPTLFTSSTIIQLMDEEMRSDLIPLVKTLNEEYWVTTLSNTIVAGQTSYPIPYRATGIGLRDIMLQDSNGNNLKLTRYEPEDTKFPLIPYGSPFFPLGYYLQDNSVIFFPSTSSNYTSYTLLMKYERRPNNLISQGSAGQIVSIDTNLNQVVMTFVPTSWTTSTTVDIINNLPPFNSIADDLQITGKNGLTLTLSSLPTGLAVNQWIAQSMQTPIAQIPYEAFPILSQMTVVKVLESLGDNGSIDRAAKKLDKMKEDFRGSMTPRVEGTPKTLSNRGGVFDYGRNVWGNWGGW